MRCKVASAFYHLPRKGKNLVRGKCGLKIIPNVHISDSSGSEESLLAYPKHVLISIGTNGFTWEVANRDVFMNQVSRIVDLLEPIGIIVYDPAAIDIFITPRFKGIPIYQFDSFMQKRNSSRKRKKGGDGDEK